MGVRARDDPKQHIGDVCEKTKSAHAHGVSEPGARTARAVHACGVDDPKRTSAGKCIRRAARHPGKMNVGDGTLETQKRTGDTGTRAALSGGPGCWGARRKMPWRLRKLPGKTPHHAVDKTEMAQFSVGRETRRLGRSHRKTQEAGKEMKSYPSSPGATAYAKTRWVRQPTCDRSDIEEGNREENREEKGWENGKHTSSYFSGKASAPPQASEWRKVRWRLHQCCCARRRRRTGDNDLNRRLHRSAPPDRDRGRKYNGRLGHLRKAHARGVSSPERHVHDVDRTAHARGMNKKARSRHEKLESPRLRREQKSTFATWIRDVDRSEQKARSRRGSVTWTGRPTPAA
ncbi:hypothetical protein C8J57DRAFT_1218118 [Mycena rebaudengoi]|nr:hypothetical protein C8J57DRAFT_1218118 [Mycena rebaudengoi]